MSGTSQVETAEDQLARWRILVDEHETLRSALREHCGQGEVQGLSPHISQLKTETALSQAHVEKARKLKVQPDEDEANRLGQHLISSNLTSCEAQWDIIKKFNGVKSLSSYFSKTSRYGPRHRAPRGVRDLDNVLVNAVVGDGAEWVRIFTSTERRVLLDMAANGWEFGEESDDVDAPAGDDIGASYDSGATSDDDISILRIVADLVTASRVNRLEHNYGCPAIRVLFTRLQEGKIPDIDTLIRRIRRLGDAKVHVTVECADAPFVKVPSPPFATALPRLLPNELRDLTSTVNVDTSILVALVSDISHFLVDVQPRHSDFHAREIQRENENPGKMLALVWSSLKGRRLVTTREAAASLGKLVQIIGTPTEQKRAHLLLSQDPSDGTVVGDEDATSESQKVVAELRKLSIHAIPDDLQLPIQILDEDWDLARIQTAVDDGTLPEVALHVAPEMTVPTVSVFCYGWASGQMTITTNASARRQIARLIDKCRSGDEDDNRGPNVWLVGTARSLNGKEKD